jgi:hypothetical protein
MRAQIMRKWTPEDLALLRELWAAGLPRAIIAVRLRRSMRATKHKAWELKLEADLSAEERKVIN